MNLALIFLNKKKSRIGTDYFAKANDESVLTDLPASWFTNTESKPGDPETNLTDTLDAPTNRFEWDRNARLNFKDLAGKFIIQNFDYINRIPICLPTVEEDSDMVISFRRKEREDNSQAIFPRLFEEYQKQER